MVLNNILRFVSFISITITTVLVVLLFYKYDGSLTKAYSKIEDMEKIKVSAFAKNIENTLRYDYGEYLEKPFSIEEPVRKEINELLSMFTGEQYSYVFLVAYDKKGKFRYIFDGAKNLEDKGSYLQKFDPVSDKWDEIVKTNEPTWVSQTSIDGLWLTYLHPIQTNGEEKLILAFDFSAKEYYLVKEIFSPINKYLVFIAAVLGIFLTLVYVLGYLFYKQKQRTFVDSLTGLYNRYYLNNIINTLKLKDICIAIIDIDHFKRVNDMYGHDVGDIVLKEFSQKLKEVIRPEDILIRYGGEEFLLFLSKKNMQDGEEESIIHSIQKRISEKSIKTGQDDLKITASIGFNATPYLSRSFDSAINTADKMLYKAKINGRNKVEIFEERRRNENVIFGPREIIEALKEDRVRAYFQPIMCANTDRIFKYEMLVRVFTRSGKMILPYKFLPNIKSNSSYRYMSRYMLRQAFEAIDKHRISVSVNFDVSDFLDETLYEQIYDILSVNQESASLLTIELLESSEIRDFSIIQNQIQKIQALGVDIAIDDFGAGYSTFNYFLMLEPDVVKIDGSLIKNLVTSKEAKMVVSSIVALCQKMNIKVVAEFVENVDIVNEAKSMGIHYLQGYAIGKPSPSLEIVK